VTQKPAGTWVPSIRESSPQVRALAANDRDLRLVDLLETQHVAAHPRRVQVPHAESSVKRGGQLCTCKRVWTWGSSGWRARRR
jgi:hypothetical protein